jgi:hypothetical protein
MQARDRASSAAEGEGNIWTADVVAPATVIGEQPSSNLDPGNSLKRDAGK